MVMAKVEVRHSQAMSVNQRNRATKPSGVCEPKKRCDRASCVVWTILLVRGSHAKGANHVFSATEPDC